MLCRLVQEKTAGISLHCRISLPRAFGVAAVGIGYLWSALGSYGLVSLPKGACDGVRRHWIISTPQVTALREGKNCSNSIKGTLKQYEGKRQITALVITCDYGMGGQFVPVQEASSYLPPLLWPLHSMHTR